jgi:hypothetical protein
MVIDPLAAVAAADQSEPETALQPPPGTGKTGPTNDQSKVPEFPFVPVTATESVAGVVEYAVKSGPEAVVVSDGPPAGAVIPTLGGSAGRGMVLGAETSDALVAALFQATSFTSPLGTVTV